MMTGLLRSSNDLRRLCRRANSTALLLLLGLMLPAAQAKDASALALSEKIEEGHYLARAADCTACHTRPGSSLEFAGGYPIISPLGVIYSSNITPSKIAGIGNYSEAQFANALRNGIRADGAHLYPAMPYTSYSQLKDEDIHSLYLYFMHGVVAVDNVPPQTALPFPFNIRSSMLGWNLLFLKKGPFIDNPDHSEAINRGAYLSQTLAHCSVCHTPRNVLMAEQDDKLFTGAALAGWHAPNITSDPVSGIGGWSDAELVSYLQTGVAQGKARAGGGMAEVVEDSLQYLKTEDISAIVSYLRTIPPIRSAQDRKSAFSFGQPSSSEATLRGLSAINASDSLNNGAALFSSNCSSCHQPDGRGSNNQAFPPLFNSSTTGGSHKGEANNLVATILFGVDRNVGGTQVFMPGFGTQSAVNALSDQQIALIANHVSREFGDPTLQISAEQVALIRAGGAPPLLARVQPYLALLLIVALMLLGLVSVVLYRRRRRPH